MKILRIFLGAALVLSPLPALASGACYTPEQVRAEQLLRLHSELMVITVTCRQGSDGSPLPAAYTSFTRKNIGALHEAEQTMIKYYKSTAKGDAVGHLDRLRTLLGNEYGQKVADMTSSKFCEAYRDKVAKLAEANSLDDEIQSLSASAASYVRPCGGK